MPDATAIGITDAIAKQRAAVLQQVSSVAGKPATQPGSFFTVPWIDAARQSVQSGTKLLKQLLAKYNNDVTLTLAAYNAGSERVDKDGAVPQPA